jgi:hypothetical protein
MEDVWYYVLRMHNSNGGKPIPEQRIVAYIAEKFPAQNVARVMDVMIQTGIFLEVAVPEAGRWFRPRSRAIS